MADASKKAPEESPFILDADGNWTLNPNRPPTYIEQQAYENMKRSREQGQPLDPIDAMSQTAEKMRIIQENKKIDNQNDFIAELKRPVTGLTEVDLLHDIATKGLEELGGLRKDVKEVDYPPYLLP